MHVSLPWQRSRADRSRIVEGAVPHPVLKRLASIPLLATLLLILEGCRPVPRHTPVIRFSKVPILSQQGGPEKVDRIEGHVSEAGPGQRIVIFTKAGRWWVQPFSDNPFTNIRADGTWAAVIHLGTEYAALLVNRPYQPPRTTIELPHVGGNILAIATAEANPSTLADEGGVPTQIHFSGYDWKVRTDASDRNGRMQDYSARNVSVDAKGFLHLHIRGDPSHWLCSEIQLKRSLGYGTYSFDVHGVDRLEPAASLGIFTWSNMEVDDNHEEMDINFGRWGDPDSKDAEYVVPPYYVPLNVYRFRAPGGPFTSSFQWTAQRVTFDTIPIGSSASAASKSEHVFTSGLPVAGTETIRINFCAFSYGRQPLQHEAEVVIERFKYLP